MAFTAPARARKDPAVGGAMLADPILFGVIGTTVNLAAKLEKHTKREVVRALTTAETHHLALEQGFRPKAKCSERPNRQVDGVEALMDLVVPAG